MNLLGSFSPLARIGACAVVFTAFLGCGYSGTPDYSAEINSQYYEAVPSEHEFTGSEFLYVEDSDIIMATVNEERTQEVRRFTEIAPTEAIFQQDAAILWIDHDEETGVHTIVEYRWLTGEETVLYTSPNRIHTLQTSAKGSFVGFIENDALFVLHTPERSLQRISEEVTEYRFSPVDMQLVFATAKKSEHVTMDDDGSIAATIELTNVEQGPLRGMAFRDDETVFGIASLPEEGLRAVLIDLRNISLDNRFEWASAVREHTDGEVHTVISPDSKNAIVQELKANEQRGILSLHSFTDNSQKRFLNNGFVVAFADEETVAIQIPATTEDDSTAYDVQLIPLDEEAGSTLIEGIHAPHFIDL